MKTHLQSSRVLFPVLLHSCIHLIVQLHLIEATCKGLDGLVHKVCVDASRASSIDDAQSINVQQLCNTAAWKTVRPSEGWCTARAAAWLTGNQGQQLP